MRQYAAKRDDNERCIIDALELAGWGVVQVSSPGLPDLYVIRRGHGVWLEVKMPGKKLTPVQVKKHAQMAAHGMRVAIVTSPEEALAAVQAENTKGPGLSTGALTRKHPRAPSTGRATNNTDAPRAPRRVRHG